MSQRGPGTDTTLDMGWSALHCHERSESRERGGLLLLLLLLMVLELTGMRILVQPIGQKIVHRSALGHSNGSIDCNGSDGINCRNQSKCNNNSTNNNAINST